MLFVVGAAALNVALLAPLHQDALAIIVGLNVAIAISAATAYAAIDTVASRRPEVVVLLVLAVIDVATVALGVYHPSLALFVAGYLLLLPTIVALVVPWVTRIHVTWLAAHAVAVGGYIALAPSSSVGGERAAELPILIVVATAVSFHGHMEGLLARVDSFTQIEQIRKLNRAARRNELRLDGVNVVLEASARTDELTGLGNRLSLRHDLAAARSRIARSGDQYAVLMIDLDRFKAINDRLGHVAGDGILRSVAGSLLAGVRSEDRVYRYGGEEFLALIRVTHPDEALLAAERIRRLMEEAGIPHPANAPHGVLTISIGVATIGPPDLGLTDDAWIAPADAALFRAKANGRNRCEVEQVQPGEATGSRTPS
jgi:diguanylate cyclase (GGDEF)-like protein